MDSVEILLREELSRVATAVAPDTREVLTGLRQRQRHRRAVIAASLTLVLAAAGLVGVVTSWHPQPINPSRPSPDVTENVVRPGTGTFWPGILRGTRLAPLRGHFDDSQHGYLAAVHCGDGVANCVTELFFTSDGAASWTSRRLPIQPPRAGADPWARNVVAREGSTVLYSCVSWDRFSCRGTDTEDRPSVELYLSVDDGISWSYLADPQPSVVDQLPLGSPALFIEAPDFEITAVSADHALVRLRTPRDMTDTSLFSAGLTVAGDGSIFVWGRQAQENKPNIYTYVPMVWVSRDRGLTWARHTIPDVAWDPFPQGLQQLATVDGRTLVYTPAPDHTGRFPYIYRSTDGGGSWQRIAFPDAAPRFDRATLTMATKGYSDDEYPGDYVSAGVLADGTILATRAGRLFRLDPGSSTLRPVGGRFGGVHLAQVGTAVLGVDMKVDRDGSGNVIRLTDVFAVTHDGRTWTEIHLS